MEDGRAVSPRPYDPRRALVCRDETSKQLLRDPRAPQPAAPGRAARVDDEAERDGVVNRLLCCEPLAGQRWVDVTAQRTRRDWAPPIQHLVDGRSPDAARIVLVLDHLTPHTPGALSDVCAPAEATRLADTLEIHSPPTHGSWLTSAEIELSVLSRHCLHRRGPDAATRARAVAAWQERRNATTSTVDWRFTTADARITLKRLYPSFQE